MIVPGEGPQPALGMIVALKALGKETHFVRDYRKIMEAALRSYGLSLSDVYVTSLVKETEDDGGDPREWLPILENERQSTAPRATLAIGGDAARLMLGFEERIPAGSVINDIYVVRHPAIGLLDWCRDIAKWAEAVRA